MPMCPDVWSIWQVLAVRSSSFEMMPVPHDHLRTALESSTLNNHPSLSLQPEVDATTDNQTIALPVTTRVVTGGDEIQQPRTIFGGAGSCRKLSQDNLRQPN